MPLMNARYQGNHASTGSLTKPCSSPPWSPSIPTGQPINAPNCPSALCSHSCNQICELPGAISFQPPYTPNVFGSCVRKPPVEAPQQAPYGEPSVALAAG